MTQISASSQIARQILEHRKNGRRPSDASWSIQDEDQAEAIQELVATWIAEPVTGWKVGGTDAPARERLKLARPFLGRVFNSGSYRSGATLRPPIASSCLFEFELLACIGTDLPPHKAYSKADIEAAVVSWHLGFELITLTNPPDGPIMNGLHVLADNGGCAGMVVGPKVSEADMLSLPGRAAAHCINGEASVDATVASTKAELIERILWLANHISERGFGLAAGQFVLTGNLTGMARLNAGDVLTASLAGMGEVSITMPQPVVA